jgi:hypothetical protein
VILLNTKRRSHEAAMEQSLSPKIDCKRKNRLYGQTYSCLFQGEELRGSRTTAFGQQDDDVVAKVTMHAGSRQPECLYRNRDARDVAQLFEFLLGECQRRSAPGNL